MSEALIDLLWLAARTGRAELPDDVTLGIEDGQRMQVQMLSRWREAGHDAVGWKLGLTSGASRDAFGPGIRPFGFILDHRVFESGSRIAQSAIGAGLVENEFCYCLGEAVGAGASAADARAAVSGVAPSFELNQQRIDTRNTPAGVRVADNLSNWGLVVGTPVPVPDRLPARVRLFASQGADDPEHEIDQVATAGHADDHFETIARLANELARHGLRLEAGHRVITGAYTRTPLQPGRYAGEFGESLGRVRVEIFA